MMLLRECLKGFECIFEGVTWHWMAIAYTGCFIEYEENI